MSHISYYEKLIKRTDKTKKTHDLNLNYISSDTRVMAYALQKLYSLSFGLVGNWTRNLWAMHTELISCLVLQNTMLPKINKYQTCAKYYNEV